MPIINTNKKYDFLVTFGCSFTGGHDLGPNGAWGHFLANRLGCNHVNKAGGAANPNILTNVINFCEHNNMSNACVGIQWSEMTRRPIWLEDQGIYFSFGSGTLLNDNPSSLENKPKEFLFIKNNLEFFMPMWFDLRECVLTTVLSMIQAKAYLEYKNIDFIMFEGINSIMDRDENHRDITYDVTQIHDLALLNTNIKKSILDDVTFFNELGDMNKCLKAFPLFDSTLNDGHPHPEFLEYWTDHLYNYIKNYNQ